MKKLPEPFVERMKTRLPEAEFDDFIQAYQVESQTSIRLNPTKNVEIDDLGNSIPWFPMGKYLPSDRLFITDPLWHAGAYYVQEASSMVLGNVFKQLYGENSPQRALDLCAAPGGKSTLLQGMLAEGSVMIANEVIKSRVQILKENHIRLGISENLIITNNDPKDFTKLGEFFDYIQVDAPCSGEGMFRKDGHALNEWSEANCSLCSERSHRILADILPTLAKDGYLVYSTCTFNPNENEVLLKEISEDFEVQSIPLDFPEDWGIRKVFYEGIYGYYFYPHQVKGEGLFVSVLHKTEGETLKTFNIPKKTKSDSISELVSDPNIFQKEGQFYYKTPLLRSIEKELIQKLRIIYSGIELGIQKGKNFIPEQSLANFHKDLHHFPKIEVDQETALEFLRGQDPKLSLDKKGIYLLTYRGLGIGFIKYLGNRSNNYYPKPWRVRNY